MNQLEILKALLKRDPDRVRTLYETGKLRVAPEHMAFVEDHFGFERSEVHEQEKYFHFYHPSFKTCKLLAVYVKGKKKNAPYRFLFEDSNKELYLIWFDIGENSSYPQMDKAENISMNSSIQYNCGFTVAEGQYHFKSGVYNYYLQEKTDREMIDLFRECMHEFVSVNPRIHDGNYIHKKYNDCDKEFVYDYQGNPVK